MSVRGPLAELGRAVARRQDAVLEACDADPSLRQRVAQFAASAPNRRVGRSRRLVGSLAAVVLALAFVAVRYLRSPALEPPALTFTVGTPPTPGIPGELAVAPRESHVPMTFSEGTMVLLDPDARARVVALGPRGAEVILESGQAHLDVVPRPHGDWSVRAGPFAVRVKGTQFDVGYDPVNDEFSLALHQGKVVVSGCGFGSGRPVEAGERLRASCDRRKPADQSAPSAGMPADAVALPDPRRASDVARSDDAPAAARPQPKQAVRTWIDWARSGYYAEAYELTRGDFGAECQRRGAEEVLLLGDTARLSGHSSEARRAYAEVRNRFPGSPDAAQAAFSLGRLALQADGDRKAAERWFETNLRERPNSPMASVVLGRLLELRLERGDRTGAEAAAREYLQRFPEGPRASDARKLLGAGNVLPSDDPSKPGR